MSDSNSANKKPSKKLSGAQFRKRAKQKEEQAQKLLKQISTLDKFFVNPGIASTSDAVSHEYDASTSTENDPLAGPESRCDFATTSVVAPNITKDISSDHIIEYEKDPAKWQVNNILLDNIALHGINQNISGDFSNSMRQYPDKKRFCTIKLFTRILKNGEFVNRSWLVYSPSTGNVFCAACKIFGGMTQLATSGFCDWRNTKRIEEHEENPEHRKFVNDLIKRSNVMGRVDKQLVMQLTEETKYWRNVLLRVVESVKFLASRGLGIRGHTETFGSSSNGNFMGVLELIAKFDPFLNDHIKRFGNPGKGTPSYLSHTIVDELIVQLGKQLQVKIVEELQVAKYYSIIVDSTPDVSHVDQLTFIVRYVCIDGRPVERFLTFIPNTGHKSEQLADVILDQLKTFDINIMDCRGQSYDNAANMSGHYLGLQARIKKINPLAYYIPCAAHSLNLVGISSTGFCVDSVSYFGTVQELYNFFSCSTHRWEVLISKLASNFSVKNLSATRWSAHADASKAMYTSYSEIIEALLVLSEDENEKPNTRLEARNLIEKLKYLETAFMTCFWNSVLERFNETSKKLQAINIDLGTVILLYDSLYAFLDNLRDSFSTFESEAINLCNNESYKIDNSRKKKRKLHFDETEDGAIEFNGRENFRIQVFMQLIDKLRTELWRRREAYVEAHAEFGFLNHLSTLTPSEVKEKCSSLINIYGNDVDVQLEGEILQIKDLGLSSDGVLGFLKELRTRNIEDVFPNIAILLRIFACKAVTNCTGERSFSTLKRVKNYQRSKLSQSKLNALAIMCIESDLLNKINFEQVVDEFAQAKARKKPFN